LYGASPIANTPPLSPNVVVFGGIPPWQITIAGAALPSQNGVPGATVCGVPVIFGLAAVSSVKLGPPLSTVLYGSAPPPEAAAAVNVNGPVIVGVFTPVALVPFVWRNVETTFKPSVDPKRFAVPTANCNEE
jgi:hypothetical protein